MIGFHPGAIGPLGFWHILLFAVLIPWAALKSRRRLAERELPPKKKYFASVIAQQAFFLVISLWVARRMGIRLFEPYRPTAAHVAVAVATLALAVALLRDKWRDQVAKRSRRIYLVTPVDRVDHLLWTGVAISAAIAEEVSYRGTLFWVVTWLTGSTAAALAVCIAAFGVGHAIQGWRSAAIIMVFAAGFHGLVLWTGSLLLGIAVHFAYDVIAGFSYGRFAREAGIPLEPPPPADPVAPSA